MQLADANTRSFRNSLKIRRVRSKVIRLSVEDGIVISYQAGHGGLL